MNWDELDGSGGGSDDAAIDKWARCGGLKDESSMTICGGEAGEAPVGEEYGQ
jgi:hypothetical protein